MLLVPSAPTAAPASQPPAITHWPLKEFPADRLCGNRALEAINTSLPLPDYEPHNLVASNVPWLMIVPPL